ncbi:MAG: methyltransferase domain-containing protein [Acidobacteria bacterium]|nr:methyltransferase domain-containing protein [Acidobacteriota bacterium]
MESVQIAQEFQARAKQFQEGAYRLGLDDVSQFVWYHTVDLGEGLVTPGMYDYRETVTAFQFPPDMQALTVLDVGSATGFFAFEFEKRGAQVISIELPSLEQLDRFPGQTTELLLKKLAKMLEAVATAPTGSPDISRSSEQLYFSLLEGPFRFCHRRLRSNVSRCYSTVYDLTPERLGAEAFDWIFLGDILVHTLDPLRALSAVAPLCRDTLVLSQVMPEEFGSQPAMLYVGGEDPEGDDISWWWPNKLCLEQILKKLGFRTVEEVGRNRGVMYPTAHPFDRPILHARK